MSPTKMSPAEVVAELDAISARRLELMPADRAGALPIEALRERAALCRRVAAAWDALDTSAIDDVPIWKLLHRGAVEASIAAEQGADRWDAHAAALAERATTCAVRA